MTDTAAGTGPGMKVYLTIWVGLLVIVAAEVALTFAHVSHLLLWLLILAIFEASLGVLYFMHMKWENRVLLWSLVGYLTLACVMLNHIWRDAARMVSLYW